MLPNKVSLGFDTSTSKCTIAVVSGNTILAEKSEEAPKKHAERLMYLIEEALKSAKHDLSHVSSIGVGIGPGNFTGVRVSVATARGLSLALNVPAFGVTTFEALQLGRKGNILCSVRAKKDQIYLSEYQNGIFEQSIISNIDNLPKTKCNFVIGDKSNLISESLHIKLLEPIHSTASSIAKIAQEFPMEKSPPKPIYPIHNEFI
ncbi:MAG: tRNA (adenosine(37)-N6)-threonylcarbamoyltransferase complex dimerization subunit type 1 TsaB [Rhodobacteraceae bacterium]|nr:tRNA (adenosine(37)-N6)-threonylcarbamoyltransferase complex dimerization subunit type 1 TsaB [Paracoccaceae bacterium]